MTGSGRPAFADARWYAIRRAQSTKPATYRCPICGGFLPALTEHVLVLPEGDAGRRRHAHTACVARRRATGRLPSRDEWRRTQPRPPSAVSRLLSRLRGG
ncbi:MAG TPA: hypothetical protein VFT50_06800 [Baekduia sp.]|nr:hypothetical protein [Baekduia sp.]